jgi:ppGpp synthetase/RelA/SpoT-type nucleotidyltranferase
MRDLEPIREAWLRDRPRYDALVKHLTANIERLVKDAGVWSRVTGRTKELDSLLKKCLRRQDLEYAAIADRAGIRVVTRFLENLPIVCKVVEDNLKVTKKEDFSVGLGTERFSYQGVHLDVVMRGNNREAEPFVGLLAEIQVRTLSQDLWSEMAHELTYKAEFEVPGVLSRRVNCLSALIETCDREFSLVNKEIMQLTDAQPLRVLASLEKQFYKITARHYDKELSIDVIRGLLPLYSMDVSQFDSHFEDFYRIRQEKINHILGLYAETPTRSLFLFQPEALMIFDLLEKDRFRLINAWVQHFPEIELERLANAWGTALR